MKTKKYCANCKTELILPKMYLLEVWTPSKYVEKKYFCNECHFNILTLNWEELEKDKKEKVVEEKE